MTKYPLIFFFGASSGMNFNTGATGWFDAKREQLYQWLSMFEPYPDGDSSVHEGYPIMKILKRMVPTQLTSTIWLFDIAMENHHL